LLFIYTVHAMDIVKVINKSLTRRNTLAWNGSPSHDQPLDHLGASVLRRLVFFKRSFCAFSSASRIAANIAAADIFFDLLPEPHEGLDFLLPLLTGAGLCGRTKSTSTSLSALPGSEVASVALGTSFTFCDLAFDTLLFVVLGSDLVLEGPATAFWSGVAAVLGQVWHALDVLGLSCSGVRVALRHGLHLEVLATDAGAMSVSGAELVEGVQVVKTVVMLGELTSVTLEVHSKDWDTTVDGLHGDSDSIVNVAAEFFCVLAAVWPFNAFPSTCVTSVGLGMASASSDPDGEGSSEGESRIPWLLSMLVLRLRGCCCFRLGGVDGTWLFTLLGLLRTFFSLGFFSFSGFSFNWGDISTDVGGVGGRMGICTLLFFTS
jgi:hypothetical protein